MCIRDREIRVPNVIVNGKVFGDINSDRHVELAAKAEVKGNVYYNLIEMVMGSWVDGHLVHIREKRSEVTSAQDKPEDTGDVIGSPQVAALNTSAQ